MNMNLSGRVSFLFVSARRALSSAHFFKLSEVSKGAMRVASVVAVLLGMAVGGVPVSGPVYARSLHSSQHDASTVARARAAFLKAMSSRRPMVRSSLAPLADGAGAKSAPSANWSGYAAAEKGSQRVSSVSGEWVIPEIECPGGNYKYQDAFLAQWVGIDGYNNGTVEQLGSGVQCFEGVTYYYVWYEMYPAGSVEEGTVACINNNIDCPQPGDRIAASVTVTGDGTYTLKLTDFSRPQESFSVTQSCAPSTCVDSSAEWIVERPATDLPPPAPAGLIQILPLADFSRADFFNGAVTSGGRTTHIEGFKDGTVYDIAMTDDTASYFLDCVGQRGYGHPELLLTSDPTACPTMAPYKGSFTVGWDSSF
jgi:hypothetical protein